MGKVSISNSIGPVAISDSSGESEAIVLRPDLEFGLDLGGVLRLGGKAGFGLMSGWSVAVGGSFSIRALVRCPGQEPVRCHPWGCFACRRQRAVAEHGRAEWGSDETRLW
ncbi:hypothetical protein TH9_16185 [Thalassospira xiamenensis]|nr:hypothetical protein TH9_16185 [Thalassospira xiamenensis]